MVIDDLDLKRITLPPTKTDTILVIYPNTVFAYSLAL